MCIVDKSFAPVSFLVATFNLCYSGYVQGPGGVTVKKTTMSLIIGIYDEPMTPGQCNMIVERLGDYLLEQGF